MTESLINEWLAECKDVSPSELHTFASTLSQDNEIVRALYILLEERTKYSEVYNGNLRLIILTMFAQNHSHYTGQYFPKIIAFEHWY